MEEERRSFEDEDERPLGLMEKTSREKMKQREHETNPKCNCNYFFKLKGKIINAQIKKLLKKQSNRSMRVAPRDPLQEIPSIAPAIANCDPHHEKVAEGGRSGRNS